MDRLFKKGDQVEWEIAVGKMQGVVEKRLVCPVRYKGLVYSASKEDPIYLVNTLEGNDNYLYKAYMLSQVETYVAPILVKVENLFPKVTAIVLTVGCSATTKEEFFKLLRAHGVSYIADVRSQPKSPKTPQFGENILKQELKEARIGYCSFKGLSGARKPKLNSVNTGWERDSFRGFADYMQTPAFEENLDRLVNLAMKETVAILGSQSLPWKCHRSLISDALLVRGIKVQDIITEECRQIHGLTEFAIVSNGKVTYPKTLNHVRYSEKDFPQRGKFDRNEF